MCGSTKCPKYSTCKRAVHMKQIETVVDWYNYGGGSAWYDGETGESHVEIYFDCGPNADYAMYVPI